MKAVFLSLIFLFVWILIGYFFPLLNFFLSWLVFPIVFFVASLLGLKERKNVLPYGNLVVYFLLLFMNDYLFRIFSGVINDDAGRGWFDLTFYATLGNCTLMFMMLKVYDNMGDDVRLNKIFFDVLIVLILAAMTLLFFRKFNMFI